MGDLPWLQLSSFAFRGPGDCVLLSWACVFSTTVSKCRLGGCEAIF